MNFFDVAFVAGYAAVLAATIALCRIIPNRRARRRRATFAIGDTLTVGPRGIRVTLVGIDPLEAPIDSQFAEVRWPSGYTAAVPVRLLRKP